MYSIDFIRVLANGWPTKRLFTANMEEVYPANLLEHPQQTFLWYSLYHFSMAYKAKMAFHHHYSKKSGSTACTGMVEVMTKPNFMNQRLLILKTAQCFSVKWTLPVRNKHLCRALIASYSSSDGGWGKALNAGIKHEKHLHVFRWSWPTSAAIGWLHYIKNASEMEKKTNPKAHFFLFFKRVV